MPQPPRNCVETKNFELCKNSIIKELSISDGKFDEAYLFPMQQLVVFKPDLYPAVENSGLHVFATDATPKYPSIYIAYTFDEENVYLQYAEVKQVNNE